MTALLEIENLRTVFDTGNGEAVAVDGLSLSLDAGETLAVVGESGCGKSVTALSIMRLVQEPPGRIAGGRILFDGRDLMALGERDMQRLRGNEITMVFQEPMTSLNPVFTVGSQIAEAFRLHRSLGRREAWAEAVRMLGLVEIPEPAARARDYPHQLSGGMRQRVMIAMALSCQPRLLIADEPTTALDVTIEAQILDLLMSLRDRMGMALMLITHDLGLVANRADHLVVMYAGRAVEQGRVAEVFSRPAHPYTRGLLGSQPRLGGGRDRLDAIAGTVPSLTRLPAGCRFRDRCRLAEAACADDTPGLSAVGTEHWAACPVTVKGECG